MHGGNTSQRFDGKVVAVPPRPPSTTQVAARRLSAYAIRALPVLCFGGLALRVWSEVLRHTRGTFTYSLDDPYIHLALAENIARGSYGVNLGEISAPSSSLLWPFLLAPFARTPWAELTPLLLNLLASAASLLLVGAFLRASFASRTVPAELAVALASLLFALCTNLLGLTFLGMEHSLQVLLVIALLHGTKLEQRDGRLRAFTLLAFAVLPLVRYESLMLVGPLFVYFARRGHLRRVAIAASLSALALAAFSIFLSSHGLGFLPTSVEAKSSLHSSAFERASTIVRKGWEDPHVFTFFLGAFAFALLAVLARSARARDLALALCAATVGHLYIGNFGWFDRYEIYLYTAQILGLTWLVGEHVAALAAPRGLRVAALAASALLMISGSYLVRALQTPAAARNIYEQQRQMHHFAADLYRKPVAVNDLGLVSLRNDAYVLDLSGLASREVLLARRREPPRAWRERLLREHGVGLAMIYHPGADSVPLSWTHLGTLHLAGPLVTCAAAEVEFYATTPEARAELRPLIARFQADLPDGVRFVATNADLTITAFDGP